MEQHEINQAEWENPQNWSGPKWACAYFSKKDSRTWVPKRIPSMGWTVNLGKTAGLLWLAALLAGIPTVIVLFMVL